MIANKKKILFKTDDIYFSDVVPTDSHVSSVTDLHGINFASYDQE